MTLGTKLARLRREHTYTQEQLAEILGVSRQAISKWESDTAYPETEKLVRLGRLYHCSMDYLLLDEIKDPAPARQPEPEPQRLRLDLKDIGYERVSRHRIGSLPLWHVNVGYGRVAKGVFALGLRAKGIVSCGLLSLGVVSFGVLGLGVLSIGAFALGLIALGAISAGVLAVGAVALGIFSLGACAIGKFAIGAAAIGQYAAFGDAARGAVAVGMSDARGSLYQRLIPLRRKDLNAIREILEGAVPGYLAPFRRLFVWLLSWQIEFPPR